MSTVKDVQALVNRFHQEGDMFGSELNVEEEYKRRIRQVGRALEEENSVLLGDEFHPPDDLVLGEKSQKLFDELAGWFARQARR